MVESNLKTLFQSAETLRENIESARDGDVLTQQQAVHAAIARYKECLLVADRISLYSPNETIDDLTAGDLQYFLIHYRLAELLNRTFQDDRRSTIQCVREAIDRFLHLLDQYDILSSSDKGLYERYLESPTTFATSHAEKPDAQRSAKIARYKQEKALQSKIQSLRQCPSNLENDDDDVVREIHLTMISLCTHKAFQELESLNRELKVLAMAPPSLPENIESLERDYRERMGLRKKDDGTTERLDRPSILNAANPGPILSASGKPLRPFTLLDSRQTLKKGVFRSGHNLPTMTIDEYLEEERARGGIIEGGGAASGLSPEPDEDNYDKADQETMKAREWDEFTEQNHKGSGNTLNKG